MSDPSSILMQHLKVLALGYLLSVSKDYKWVIVHSFTLPSGFNLTEIDILVEIPSRYPCSPPGIGNFRIYIPSQLRYKGKILKAVYSNVNPGWGDWAWLCYKQIKWDPTRDDLVSLMEIIRIDLTHPPT